MSWRRSTIKGVKCLCPRIHNDLKFNISAIRIIFCKYQQQKSIWWCFFFIPMVFSEPNSIWKKLDPRLVLLSDFRALQNVWINFAILMEQLDKSNCFAQNLLHLQCVCVVLYMINILKYSSLRKPKLLGPKKNILVIKNSQ